MQREHIAIVEIKDGRNRSGVEIQALVLEALRQIPDLHINLITFDYPGYIMFSPFRADEVTIRGSEELN